MANINVSIKNWSVTEASNQPDGTDSATIAGDLRAIQAGVRYLRSQDTIASASTTDLGSKDAESLSISGTTTITALGTVSAGIVKRVKFDGALTLTHNGTSLILPGAANITTAANDTAEFESLGSGNWRCNWYKRQNGKAVVETNQLADGDKGDITVSGSGATWTIDNGAGAGAKVTSKIEPISASVGSNALTISASALTLDFRSTTLGSGTVTTVTGTPANLVISSGSTLGTVSGTQSRIVVLAINNAGTIELAAVNIAGGNQLDETNLITTTAEGGAGGADSASVIYSTSARTDVAYRVIGYIESTQATAGTWATAPSTIQGAGGQAISAMASLGYGQTWQDVAGSRLFGTTYYNTTGKPILVSVENTGAAQPTVVVGGATLPTSSASGTIYGILNFIVPSGQSYSITSGTKGRWLELR